MAAYIGSNPMLFMFLNGSTSCLLALGLLPEATRARFDFTFWFIAALPLALVVGAGSLLMLLLVLRPGKVAAISHSRLNTQLTILGKVTKREIAMTVILLATVVGWNVGPALGLSSSAVGLISLLAAVLVGAFNKQSLQSLNWDFLVAYGVVLAISPLTVQLGVDKMAAQAVKGIIGDGGVNPLLFVMVVAVLNLIVRILLPQDQALLLLALALVPTAPVLGIDPWIIAITLLATFSTWFFPSQTIGYLVAAEAAEHRLFTNQQAVRACAGFTAVTLLGLAVSVPYWHWLGLL
jgi:di/tricarboxylate transporter